MSLLESHGIESGNDEQHIIANGLEITEPDQFFEKAKLLLAELTPVIWQDVIPNLEQHEGRLNPAGFAVFPLGMHDLGSLRLHVWSANAPRKTERGPSIHNHAWHLASTVLRGVYKDTIYNLEPGQDVDLAQVFRSRLDARGQDVLMADDTYVRPVKVEDRIFYAGQTHTIEMGTYHMTDIAPHQLTATLVVDSPAFAETTEVVMYPDMAQGRQEITRERHVLDQVAKTLIKQELLSSNQ